MKTIEFYINPGVCEYGKHIFDIDDKLTEKEIKNCLKEWIWIKLRCEFHEVNSNPLGELQDKKALEDRIMGTVVVEDFSVAEEGAKSGENDYRND